MYLYVYINAKYRIILRYNIYINNNFESISSNNIVIFHFTQYIACTNFFNKVTYWVLKYGKPIIHIYS